MLYSNEELIESLNCLYNDDEMIKMACRIAYADDEEDDDYDSCYEIARYGCFLQLSQLIDEHDDLSNELSYVNKELDKMEGVMDIVYKKLKSLSHIKEISESLELIESARGNDLGYQGKYLEFELSSKIYNPKPYNLKNLNSMNKYIKDLVVYDSKWNTLIKIIAINGNDIKYCQFNVKEIFTTPYEDDRFFPMIKSMQYWSVR